MSADTRTIASVSRPADLFSALLVAGALLGLQTAAFAADEEAIAAGRADFQRHCAVCHGLDGTGEGPLASFLIRMPPDLTRIAAGLDGTFPVDRVAAVVDGRADVAAHGPREMPVWGYRFSETADRDASGPTPEDRIINIVRYLQTLQRP